MFMKLPRRNFLHLAAGAAALPAVSRIAWAQAYPSRPVRVVVGYPPGGAADISGRLIGKYLSDRLGQPFVIENRPGAGGNIGTEAVVKAPPDGYTLLIVNIPHAFNATLYDNLNFNFIRDIAGVGMIYRQPLVLEVNPAFPAKTVSEFVAFAKGNPGKINMASAGIGTPQHLAGELFKRTAGVDLLHVPYRGGAPALTDLLGGQVQVMLDTLNSSIEHIKAGRLRALAVTTATRSEALPNIPTIADFLPGYEVSSWSGVGAPRNTPAAIIDRLNSEINAVLADPAVKARFAELGTMVTTLSPAAFDKFIADETEKWGKVIRAAGIKAE
jgi:tripartite-type tricarboxylate transporter receptor subunit TctC